MVTNLAEPKANNQVSNLQAYKDAIFEGKVKVNNSDGFIALEFEGNQFKEIVPMELKCTVEQTYGCRVKSAICLNGETKQKVPFFTLCFKKEEAVSEAGIIIEKALSNGDFNYRDSDNFVDFIFSDWKLVQALSKGVTKYELTRIFSDYVNEMSVESIDHLTPDSPLVSILFLKD